MRPLPLHHVVWLKSHPLRTPEWLTERLADGFDIHHVDGDHANNDPGNLVLIELVDHQRLHGRPMLDPARALLLRKGNRTAEAAKLAYEARVAGGSWDTVGSLLPRPASKATACRLAREHAEHNDLPWPIVLSQEAEDRLIRIQHELKAERMAMVPVRRRHPCLGPRA